MAFCVELTLYARKNMVSTPVLRHLRMRKRIARALNYYKMEKKMTIIPLDLVLDRRVEPCSSRFFVQVNASWWSRLQIPVVTEQL